MLLILIGIYLLYLSFILCGIDLEDYNRHKRLLKSKSSDILSETKLLLAKSWE